MSKKSAISIALATYNGERYLSEQLESLRRQTVTPMEVVVCDDGSTDRTLDLLEVFRRTALFPVKINRNPQRLGYRENFLQCMAQCVGDYISPCDQDDVWHPNKLEVLAQTVSDEGYPDLVIHRGTICNSEGRPSGSHYPSCKRREVLPPLAGDPWLNVPGFAQCVARSLLQALPSVRRPADPNRPGEMLAHDQWIYFLAHILGTTLLLPKTLVNYRRHRASVTAIQTRRMRISPLRHPRLHVADKFAARNAELSLLAEIAEDHAGFLRSVTAAGDLTDALRTAAAHYVRMASLYRARAGLCAGGLDGVGRWHALRRLKAEGTYATFAAGGLGGIREHRRDLRYVLLGTLLPPA